MARFRAPLADRRTDLARLGSVLLLACGCSATGHQAGSPATPAGAQAAGATASVASHEHLSTPTSSRPSRPTGSSAPQQTPGSISPANASAASNGFVPPAPGAYHYSGTDADGKSQKFELDNAVSNSGSATKVVTTMKNGDGKTAATTATNWTPGQILVTDIKIGDANCHWSPPSPMALGPSAGRRWHIDSSCVVTAQGYTVHVHEQGTGTVQRAATATVGGESRPAWWVLTSVTLTIQSKTASGDFTLQDKSRTHSLLIPGAGLAAQTDQYDEWSGFGKTKSTEQHMTLQSLTPS